MNQTLIQLIPLATKSWKWLPAMRVSLHRCGGKERCLEHTRVPFLGARVCREAGAGRDWLAALHRAPRGRQWMREGKGFPLSLRLEASQSVFAEVSPKVTSHETICPRWRQGLISAVPGASSNGLVSRRADHCCSRAPGSELKLPARSRQPEIEHKGCIVGWVWSFMQLSVPALSALEHTWPYGHAFGVSDGNFWLHPARNEMPTVWIASKLWKMGFLTDAALSLELVASKKYLSGGSCDRQQVWCWEECWPDLIVSNSESSSASVQSHSEASCLGNNRWYSKQLLGNTWKKLYPVSQHVNSFHFSVCYFCSLRKAQLGKW